MVYVFLDESGDLGFKKSSSTWFLFTVAITPDKRALERVVKRIRRTLRKKHKNLGELHAYHADSATRRRVLQEISSLKDIHIVCVILNKKKVYIDLQNQKNYLYNYTANILLDRLCNKKTLKTNELIELYVDRKDTNKKLQEKFIIYISEAMNKRRLGAFSIKLHKSNENKSLQAVDFISWAIFRKYERGDYEFYEIIKAKIIDEKILFP
ncbi:hypothetical protein A3D80_01850 [Candidatus Roizmanbacteria bacterium RIFCSPHIGHO2_02_FULL_40_13b]|uniref:DUF3800 domain-containing protein n=1 Tax=Candidatus Roizmanbacteria bacterium RIFCSPHIGHO2_01_FULL_39_24 TaxID=1802032 RepID=A0A1F7GLM7_9BACT|nr:MAG: hypothetical protein A2799_01590 [Candidatus Roizmanbacteria bacterium RIFCSPHIGHO2_01_FULL_39_24]OGK27833.1 MAG: hypothetical protein A3D80_01850 [Candidatus Roizmanbacteria bacterium RIFCSPHIGHO2_02_FULL_40_13b]OGK49975.1 MAG: hypothetical protein A3A56_03010 [Candidatus Roizmanbacteria bacterium RIFCSPLOWO2_01_FULL_40_32]OGK55980.1 MAG: hypothetical protein A3H83_02805 [Candidatus Roizmanbacteria bacterium RIFCSPLOWO2_02_FULL_39_8]